MHAAVVAVVLNPWDWVITAGSTLVILVNTAGASTVEMIQQSVQGTVGPCNAFDYNHVT